MWNSARANSKASLAELTTKVSEQAAAIFDLQRRITGLELREVTHEQGSVLYQNRISEVEGKVYRLEEHRAAVAAARAGKYRIPE